MNSRLFDITAGVVVVAVIALVAGVSLVSVAARKRAIDADNTHASRNLATLAQARQLLMQIEHIRTTNDRYLQAMLRQIEASGGVGQVSGFLERIAVAAQDHGVNVESVDPQKAVPDGNYQRTSVRLGVAGAITDVHRLLFDLETEHGPLLMERLRLAPNGAPGQCSASIQVGLLGR
jgi:Tfp pilus assembly protein PilO